MKYFSISSIYIQSIKDSILAALENNEGRLYYMALYKETKKVHKKIATPTYNDCIRDLISNGLIAKEHVDVRGKPVYHFLTNKGKQRVNLLPGGYKNQSYDEIIERREKLRSVYLLTLFLFRQSHTYNIGSKRKLDDFFSENNLSSGDIIQITLPKSEENKIGEIITNTGFRHKAGIRISKIETSNGKNKRTIYECTLPGLSVKDVLMSDNKPVFGYIKLTETEVQDAFELLHDEGLIKPIRLTYNGNLRYEFSDFFMEDLLEYCVIIYHMTYEIIEVIWNNIRKPTPDEIRWIEHINGYNVAVKMRRKSNEARSKRSKSVKKNKKDFLTKATQKILEHRDMIKHDIPILKKEYDEQINKYHFLCDELFELIYPKFLQRLSFAIP